METVQRDPVEFRIHGPQPPRAVEFDADWRAVYLRLRDDRVDRSEEVAEGVVVDRGADDRIVGIEIVGLGAERCMQILTDLRRAYLHEAPELASVEVVAA